MYAPQTRAQLQITARRKMLVPRLLRGLAAPWRCAGSAVGVPSVHRHTAAKNVQQLSTTATNATDAAPRIALTPAEESLFDFLVYIQYLFAPQTQLRVAGGWVRDKLRGAPSEDIDIVLDNSTGKQFANYITTFQRQRKLPMSSVGLVKANSEKSKHLEVATVCIEGRMVDFVHLRAEEYSDDSRVPTTTLAKPTEDASRRDITINALFYNLHTQQVEDFTGSGLRDLAAGIVRTPLEPYQTFLDDPLRVLRAIRFACDFKFQLDEKLTDAVLHHSEIKQAMVRKVSRERIGIEVRKMLSGTDPARAFRMLADFNLLDVVLNDAPKPEEAGESTDVATNGLPDLQWTKELEAQAFEWLQYLQQSRLSTASHHISCVEATGAMLMPLYVPLPDSSVSVPLITSPPSWEDMDLSAVSEELLLRTALGFLDDRDRIMRSLRCDEIIERLKLNVKWPKPAAKRVALIIEAVATFPVSSSSEDDAADRLKLLLWIARYQAVSSPALSILVARHASVEQRDCHLQTLLDLVSHATVAADSSLKRVDGNVVRAHLGPQAGPQIARSLEVLRLWESVYYSTSEASETAIADFLRSLTAHSK